jgi:hypothetical protein
VPSFGGDDCGDFGGFVAVADGVGGSPGVVEGGEAEVAGDAVVVGGLGEGSGGGLEAVGVEGRTDLLAVVGEDEFGAELLPDFLIVLLGLLLEESGDVDVLGPLLLVLFALQALHFYQVRHFNFQLL